MQKHHLSVDEYYGLAAIGLCKAGSAFDGSKSKFSTFAYKCMFTTVFSEIRNMKAVKRIPENQILYYQAETENDDGDAVAFVNCIPSKENVEESALSNILLDEYMGRLKDRDRQIFILFSEGYKQGKIGKMVGCSQAQVSRVGKKLRKYLAG